MKITKIGHCCLVIKVKGLTIMTDPGAWTDAQNTIKGVDVVLITHEHQDHFYIDSIKRILVNNPSARIITNSAVGKLLDLQKIPFEILEDSDQMLLKEVLIEGFGKLHAEIYPEIQPVMNTGYMINNEFYYPGDAFYEPSRPVKILALPVCGPWMRMAEALDFAKKIKPEIVFPVHDEMLKITGPFYGLPKMFLEKSGIKFTVLESGKEIELS